MLHTADYKSCLFSADDLVAHTISSAAAPRLLARGHMPCD